MSGSARSYSFPRRQADHVVGSVRCHEKGNPPVLQAQMPRGIHGQVGAVQRDGRRSTVEMNQRVTLVPVLCRVQLDNGGSAAQPIVETLKQQVVLGRLVD